ncbi:MAG TPA: AMP-binding protein, partial [Bryobacteraceae bacterium]
YHPTWYTAGPTLHHAILPLVESHPDVLQRAPLRFVRSIGAPMPQALMEQLERALHAPVLEGYGMTEAGAISSNTPLWRKPGSAGRSTGSEIGILSESGELLPVGCEGEIVVRGEAVMQSYRGNPEANRSAFHEGWLRTGDLGRLDADGFLFVTGRIKEIINRGGEKMLPGEVENALTAHPAVEEAVAFGVPHPTLGEDVMAVVVLKPGAVATESELRRFAGTRIADFKLPRRIVFESVIPKSPTGKPVRANLAALLAPKLNSISGVAAAATEVERRLAGIWQKILQLEDIGVRDDFFQLGGNSLAFTLLMTEIESEFGMDDQAEFVSDPTIETLARIVARSPDKQREKSPCVALWPRGSRIPFFCIPGADENPYYFLDLAKRLGEDQPFFAVRDPRPLQDRGVYTLEEHAARLCAVIRSRRPEGPYIVGGHCYGGILAFEVARQMERAGQPVELLVLFEVPTPGYPKIVRHWKKYLRQAGVMAFSNTGKQTWEHVRSHSAVWKELLRRKVQAHTRRALVSAGMQDVVAPIERIELRNQRAGRAYRPGNLSCKVVHFLAADESHDTLILDDPRLGWREKASGFSTCEVPGIADGIFRPPYVTELALQLRARLDRINAPAR